MIPPVLLAYGEMGKATYIELYLSFKLNSFYGNWRNISGLREEEWKKIKRARKGWRNIEKP